MIDGELETTLKEPLPEIVIIDEASDADGPEKEIRSKLAESAVELPAESMDIDQEEAIEFINVIKNIGKSADDACNNFIELTKAEQKGLKSIKHDKTRQMKAQNCVQEILSNREKLLHFFKCMCITCSFTSDNAQDFKNHLIEIHGSDKKKNRHGWLKCSYCLHKLASPDILVKHIIKEHGQVEHHQCPYCFYRDESKWAVLIHIQNAHPGLEPQTFETSYLDAKKAGSAPKMPKLPPYSASMSKGLKCQEKNCSFHAGSSPQNLADHLDLDHWAQASFRDFQCPHCLASFETCSRLFLHLKLCHASKKPSSLSLMLIRDIQPSVSMEVDGKISFDIISIQSEKGRHNILL